MFRACIASRLQSCAIGHNALIAVHTRQNDAPTSIRLEVLSFYYRALSLTLHIAAALIRHRN